jgi:hypothetical protein
VNIQSIAKAVESAPVIFDIPEDVATAKKKKIITELSHMIDETISTCWSDMEAEDEDHIEDDLSSDYDSSSDGSIIANE